MVFQFSSIKTASAYSLKTEHCYCSVKCGCTFTSKVALINIVETLFQTKNIMKETRGVVNRNRCVYWNKILYIQALTDAPKTIKRNCNDNVSVKSIKNYLIHKKIVFNSQNTAHTNRICNTNYALEALDFCYLCNG